MIMPRGTPRPMPTLAEGLRPEGEGGGGEVVAEDGIVELGDAEILPVLVGVLSLAVLVADREMDSLVVELSLIVLVKDRDIDPPVVGAAVGKALTLVTGIKESTRVGAATVTGRVTVEKPAVVVDVVLGADEAEASVGAYERW